MAWNTDFDFSNANLVSTEKVLKDFVNAINERCLAVDIAPLAYLYFGKETFNADNLFLYNVFDVTEAIDLKLNTLIPQYVNYTKANASQVSGSFTEFTNITSIPTWSIAEMIVAVSDFKSGTSNNSMSGFQTYVYMTFGEDITGMSSQGALVLSNGSGDSETVYYNGLQISGATNNIGRFTISTTLLYVYSAGNTFKTYQRILGEELNVTSEWVDQVYNIINNLKWSVIIQGTSNIYPESVLFHDYEEKIVNGKSTWAEVVTDWATTNFTNATSGFELMASVGYEQGGGSDWNAERSVTNYKYVTNHAIIKHDADFYMYTKKGTSYAIDVYDDEGLGFDEDKYNRAVSHSNRATKLGLFDLKTALDIGVPPQPAIGQARGWQATGDGTSSTPKRFAVLRWDITGGFQYLP